jgi:two-component system NtrC family sensor kinase
MIDGLSAETVLTALLAALDSSGLGCSIFVDRGDRFERVFANQPFADILGVDLEVAPPLVHRILQSDGSEKVLETSLSHTTISGEPAIVSFTRDITERVVLQAELMRRDRLAAVGTLAAGVAHELNNPLMSLGLQARKLRQEAERHGFSEDVRSSLAQIGEAAGRMEAIIADLLFVARPSETPQAHVDVGEVMKSTVALLRAGSPHCPPIRLEIDPLPPIRAFASKLGQVFLNVLRNAVQATELRPDGEVVVRGRVAGDSLEVEVADNGVGIPAAVLSRVAQPFFTTKPQGTGLGLWISQSLMAEHGGQLFVKSVPERGTTVTLRLPLSAPPPR